MEVVWRGGLCEGREFGDKGNALYVSATAFRWLVLLLIVEMGSRERIVG